VHGKLFGFYGEDKYRVSDRITLTGGLRWDPYYPFTTTHNQIDCWNPGQQSTVYTNAPKGVIYPGDPGCGRGATTAKTLMVQPRLGIAYKVDKQGNTALRAGWGMYSTQFQMQNLIGFAAPPFVRSYEIAQVYPFISVDNPWGSVGINNPFASGFNGANYRPPPDVSFASSLATGLSIGSIQPNFRPAYVEQWTLSLQHALTHADSLELAYVGTLGLHESQTLDSNLPVYNPATPIATYNVNATRPYYSEGLVGIKTLASNSTSNYAALDATFRHRSAGGLNVVSGFTWSKCLDDGSQPATTEGFTQNGNDPRLRHGLCDFDQNVAFRTTAIWNSPDLRGENRALRAAAGAWTLSALVVADAGQPFSVVDSADNSRTAIGLDLADRVPNTPAWINGKLNPAAFAPNAYGTYGNSGRNSFRSQGWTHVDPAIMKTFPLAGERVRFMFRAEAFNVFNHPVFNAPSSDINSPGTFGNVTTARDPRIMQFSGKILF
jgi:hypothetical protein